jgi:hypothetical protein
MYPRERPARNQKRDPRGAILVGNFSVTGIPRLACSEKKLAVRCRSKYLCLRLHSQNCAQHMIYSGKNMSDFQDVNHLENKTKCIPSYLPFCGCDHIYGDIMRPM